MPSLRARRGLAPLFSQSAQISAPRARSGPYCAPAAAAEGLESRLLLAAASVAVELAHAGHDDVLEVCALPELADGAISDETYAATSFAAVTDAFALHSRPGASKVIYLDFNGHTATDTLWNAAKGIASIVTPAFSFEGDASFSSAELDRIHRIWQRVAEDYAPFDVDVTTADPGLARLVNTGGSDTQWGIRVAIGGSAGSWYGSGAGGVAYVGSFTWDSDTPCFVFTENLGSGEKYVAEAISHEAGHTLGLSHDGAGSDSYYTGHGGDATGWAPIMGVGYYRELVQWSRGQYDGATQLQDDLTIITTENGFGYRADDHGGTNAMARLLTWAGSTLSAAGVIERNTDLDVFAIDVAAAGTLTLDVTPFERGPNLDVLAELYNAAGALVASSNPVSSLAATLEVLVTAGRYYLRIDGTGKAENGSDQGYTDYGSLGQYAVSGEFTPSVSQSMITLTSSPGTVAENAGTEIVYTFTRTGNLSASVTVNFNVGGTALFGTDYSVSGATTFSSTAGSITFASGGATAVIRVRPLGDQLVESNESVLLTLAADMPSGHFAGSPASASGTIANDDFDAPPSVTGVRYGYGTNQWVSAAGLTRLAPWQITKVEYTFDRDVIVDAGDLAVSGVSGAMSFAGFSYSAGTRTAVWTLAVPVQSDRLTLRLDGDGATADGNDGVRAAGGVYPTGGGYLSGGDRLSSLDVLFGDVNGDGSVNLTDMLLLRGSNGTADRWADLNGDGTVNLTDMLLLRGRNGTRLP